MRRRGYVILCGFPEYVGGRRKHRVIGLAQVPQLVGKQHRRHQKQALVGGLAKLASKLLDSTFYVLRERRQPLLLAIVTGEPIGPVVERDWNLRHFIRPKLIRRRFAASTGTTDESRLAFNNGMKGIDSPINAVEHMTALGLKQGHALTRHGQIALEFSHPLFEC